MRHRDKIMLLLHENTSVFQVVLAGAFYPNYFTFGQPEEIAMREAGRQRPKGDHRGKVEDATFLGGDWARFSGSVTAVRPLRAYYVPFVSVCVNA